MEFYFESLLVKRFMDRVCLQTLAVTCYCTNYANEFYCIIKYIEHYTIDEI